MRIPYSVAMVLCCLFVHALSPPAQAQMCEECSACDSLCSDPCYVCRGWDLDGNCINFGQSTCGLRGGGRCIGQGCCPNYVETGYDAVGTYGNGAMFSCSHHTVYKVTFTDTNNCESPNFYQYCDDVVDGGKSGFFPDCCDGYGPGGYLDPLYTCNGWHSCF